MTHDESPTENYPYPQTAPENRPNTLYPYPRWLTMTTRGCLAIFATVTLAFTAWVMATNRSEIRAALFVGTFLCVCLPLLFFFFFFPLPNAATLSPLPTYLPAYLPALPLPELQNYRTTTLQAQVSLTVHGRTVRRLHPHRLFRHHPFLSAQIRSRRVLALGSFCRPNNRGMWDLGIPSGDRRS